MYHVVRSLYAHPHRCNFPSTGDGGKACRGDADNLSMCKSSREPLTIPDLLETSNM